MSEQQALQRKISAYSFSVWELHLFLDSHPNNREAAKKMDEYKMNIQRLTKEYEEKYGTLTETSSNSCRWQWVNSPWPWEAEANK